MILFYGEGRLGNQIFQYLALNNMAGKGETVLAFGLEELELALDLCGVQVRVLTRNGWIKRAVKYLLLPLLLRPLARYLRLFNYAYEPWSNDGPHSGLSGEHRLQLGLCKRITFVDGGYYQNVALNKRIFPVDFLRLNDELRQAAQRTIKALTPDKSMPIFIHVRRGDYLHFSSYGVSDLALPESFFRAAMIQAKQQHSSAHFLFVTDDQDWVLETFADVLEKSVVSLNPFLDFAIMCQCRGAILSNSTFSLAAALLLRDPEIVVGPRYWLGFRVNRWLPPRIRCDNPKLVYLSVLPEGSHS